MFRKQPGCSIQADQAGKPERLPVNAAGRDAARNRVDAQYTENPARMTTQIARCVRELVKSDSLCNQVTFFFTGDSATQQNNWALLIAYTAPSGPIKVGV